MENGGYAKEVDFHKALSVWAMAVLKDKPTAEQLQDPSRTVLQPLEEAIKVKVLGVSTEGAEPQAGDWSVNDLFSALNRWVLSSTKYSYWGKSYADWVKLVNCGLWLVRNLEKEVEAVDFRENSENILLQHDGGNHVSNGKIVEGEFGTVILTQTTANTLHGSARQERRWFSIAKDLAPSRFSDDKAQAAYWHKAMALLRCEHQEADFTPEEHDSLTSLDLKFLKSLELPERPKTPVEEKLEGEDEWFKRRPGGGLHDIVPILQLKEEELEYQLRPYEGAKRYLRDRLSSRVNMTHGHAMILVGRHLQLMYADRQGIILTTPIHVVREFPSFLALLFILQRFSPREWGEHPGISRSVLRVGGIRYTLGRGQRFHSPTGIVGTQSLAAHLQGPDGKLYAAKFSWQNKATHELEHNWLKKAWDAVPDDGQHLLECLGWKEFDTVTTRTIRESFGLEPGEPRRYYVIVLPPVLKVLRQLKGELWLRIFWDCFKGKCGARELCSSENLS
ncbi:hypothetical protein BDN72DRAFT_252100 [Pluteus cervinus]|uniref:Uncharacterized protein n=1 Tax=Pluteus cervinus TaxID=181527 RepID=A0ACD3AGM2_9AGAR|nr:hypothetical protein BDN72DRAFT_252100 [Pluteus cervinus]